MQPLYRLDHIPVFQNVLYASQDEAIKAIKGKVELSLHDYGYVFNAAFDPALAAYNPHYHNEQHHSGNFVSHLQEVIGCLNLGEIHPKKILEVGCGKGYFLEMLRAKGYDTIGFDPTYEGDASYIIKDYYSEKYGSMQADLIILRHVLEHVPDPFTFLEMLVKANEGKGFIFIEVPSIEWIIGKKAFWDIFYEHCNYFSLNALASFFSACKQDVFFGGQYFYVLAPLHTLTTNNFRQESPHGEIQSNSFQFFEEQKQKWKKHFEHPATRAVWGAGAKGNSFLNQVDPEQKNISFVVDINPEKQNKFIGGTGHPVIAPRKIAACRIEEMIIMNENYLEEVKTDIGNLPIRLLTL